jgi:hypothetical protein
MTKSWMRAAAAVLAVALAGCAGQVAEPVDEASDSLTWVRKADFTNRQLFMDLAVSPIPMSAAELGDTTYATPVEVRFYDEWVIAWWAPDGVARNEHFMNAVGAWRIVENAEAISGDVAPGGGGEDPPEPRAPGINTGVIDSGEALTVPVRDTLGLPDDDRNYLPYATLDWLGDRLPEWREMPPGFHPGCF